MRLSQSKVAMRVEQETLADLPMVLHARAICSNAIKSVQQFLQSCVPHDMGTAKDRVYLVLVHPSLVHGREDGVGCLLPRLEAVGHYVLHMLHKVNHSQ